MTETIGRRIRFTADFDYSPTATTTVAYKSGMVQFVRLECAEQAVAAGKAQVLPFGGPPSGLADTLARRKVKSNDTGR